MLSKLKMKRNKPNSKQTWKSWMSPSSGCMGDGSSSESEKHRHRHTQECYRCHQIVCIVTYCSSTVQEESSAPRETATAAVTTTTSIE